MGRGQISQTEMGRRLKPPDGMAAEVKFFSRKLNWATIVRSRRLTRCILVESKWTLSEAHEPIGHGNLGRKGLQRIEALIGVLDTGLQLLVIMLQVSCWRRKVL